MRSQHLDQVNIDSQRALAGLRFGGLEIEFALGVHFLAKPGALKLLKNWGEKQT